MEAPRGAREPTGTNGPTLNNKHPHQRVRVKKQRTINCRNHYTNHDQPTPPHTQTVGDSVEHQSCGGHSTGETPSNIPNLEAKPGSANGTATDRLWESRTPPQHTLSRRTSSKRMGSFAYQAQPFLAGRARSSEESQRCGTIGLVSQTIVIVLVSSFSAIYSS